MSTKGYICLLDANTLNPTLPYLTTLLDNNTLKPRKSMLDNMTLKRTFVYLRRFLQVFALVCTFPIKHGIMEIVGKLRSPMALS